MNEQTEAIVRYRLQRAKETLAEARFVLSGGYAANAANSPRICEARQGES